MHYKKQFSIRAIEKNDMQSVIDLLQFISEFKPSKSDFSSIWNEYSKQTNIFSLVAVIDKQVVGYGTILIETKIRGGKIGHVEDIVSHPLCRKKGLGKAIVNALFDIAKDKDCYKVVLQCSINNKIFYNKCNYLSSGVAMQRFVN